MNLLEILGSLSGGLSKGIPAGMEEAQSYQQSQGSSALGDALAGYQPSSQGTGGVFGGLQGLINNVMGGQQGQAQTPSIPTQQAPQAPFQAMPGIPASSLPTAASPAQIPAMSAAAPMTAQQGITPSPALTPPQQAPQQAPQGAQGPQPISAMDYARQPPQVPAPGQQQPQQQGFLTLPDLVDRLKTVRPGIRGQQMTEALRAAMPLMTEQARQQYLTLGALTRRDRQDYEWASLAERARESASNRAERQREFAGRQEQAGKHEKAVSERSAARGAQRENMARQNEELKAAREVYNKDIKDVDARVKNNQMSPADGDKYKAEITKKYNENRAAVMQKYATPQQGQGAAATSGAGTEDDPVKVKTPAEASALKPGTIYQTPDGRTMVR